MGKRSFWHILTIAFFSARVKIKAEVVITTSAKIRHLSILCGQRRGMPCTGGRIVENGRGFYKKRAPGPGRKAGIAAFFAVKREWGKPPQGKPQNEY